MSRTKHVVAAATVGLMAVSVAACGDNDNNSSSGGNAVIVGTIDSVSSLDPAGAYDYGSWEILDTVFQKVMNFPSGSSTPTPDAAKACNFTDPKTYSCTLRSGLKFSNGDELTASDVKFSFDRTVGIADPNGPSSLLTNLESTEAQGADKVIFHLKNTDATFPSVLSTDAALIVDEQVYPKDKLLSGAKVVGSGPYKLDKYTAQQQASFVVNDTYKGPRKAKNDQFVVQYFADTSGLKQAIEQGTVDVAFRTFSPTDIKDLKTKQSSGIKVVEGTGSEKRYITFDAKVKPSDKKAVRQAVAQLIDRQALADRVYEGTVQPLYSMVGNGAEVQTEAFKDKYGTADKAKAADILKKAGVKTPVSLAYYWTPSHYGAAASDEATEIKRQLDASGLFNVRLDSTEWSQYQKDYKADSYASYMIGWYPDLPDPDNDLAPFLVKEPFLATGYNNKQIQSLLSKEQGTTDAATRSKAFAQIQDIVADDVPILPLWQGKQIAVVRDSVSGIDTALDPTLFRFYELAKSGK